MTSGTGGRARELPADLPNLVDSPWEWWRGQMPITRAWAYLDHAAVGPLSGPAADAIGQFTREASQQGDTVWPQWVAHSQRLRTNMAAMLGVETAEICLVANTSTGINLVAEGWPWRPGDSVVIPEGEFPSNLFPWLNQQVRGVEVRMVPRRGQEVLVEDLLAACDGSTRMIAVSWVGYASGFRVGLQRLVEQAHRKQIAVFLDAIQGLGVFPLDIGQIPVDFLAADGHKWLLGPEGAGVAMIRRQHIDQLRPTNVGWASVKNSYNYAEPDFTLRDSASRFEAGSANLLGLTGLDASVDLFMRVLEKHGPESICQRVCQLARRLDQMLHEIGIQSRLNPHPEHQSGIVTFEVPDRDPASVRKTAAEQGVVVSCRGGGIRASIHAYNNEEDLQRLVDVVRSALRQSS